MILMFGSVEVLVFTPIYYVDLTLRDGINLQEAISSAKQMDEASNAGFEVGSEEGLDIVEKFYS